VDLGFYPLLGIYLYPYLKDPELKIERVFFLYFALFVVGNLLVHLEAFGVLHGFSARGIALGLNTIVLMIIFMGGRVIPFFTESSISKHQPKVFPALEILSHLSAWGFLIASFLSRVSIMCAVTSFAATGIHLIRLWGWQVPRVRKIPLIWVLHVSYLWLVFGFFLSG
jgi:uncharacterized protein involved in response to NO